MIRWFVKENGEKVLQEYVDVPVHTVLVVVKEGSMGGSGGTTHMRKEWVAVPEVHELIELTPRGGGAGGEVKIL